MFFRFLAVGLLATQSGFGAILKRIQTGTLSLTSVVTQTAVIDAVDPAKSFVIATGAENAASPRRQLYTIQLTNGTLITATRSQSSANAFNVRYYVVEFLRGVTVQRGMGTLSAATTNTTITSVGTLANAFTLFSYRNNNNASFGTDDFTRSNLTSTTNLQIIGQASSTSGFFEYQVVTYDQASVQRGVAALAAGDASVTATVTSLNPLKTWLYYNCDSAAGTVANIGQKGVQGVVTNATTLTFSRQNTGQAMNCSWQAIEFTDRTQVQSGAATLTAGSGTGNVTLSPEVRTGNSFAIGGWGNRCGSSTHSANDTLGPLCATFAITAPGNLLITRPQTPTAPVFPWTVVSFSKRRITFQD